MLWTICVILFVCGCWGFWVAIREADSFISFWSLHHRRGDQSFQGRRYDDNDLNA